MDSVGHQTSQDTASVLAYHAELFDKIPMVKTPYSSHRKWRNHVGNDWEASSSLDSFHTT